MGIVVSVELVPVNDGDYITKREEDYRDGDLIIFIQGSHFVLSKIENGWIRLGRGNFLTEGALDVSKITHGRIEKKERIGSGAFGNVYKGTYKEKEVALKEMRRDRKISLKDFKREADIMTGLKHENVMSLMQLWEASKEIVIVMEYMEKGSLLNYLRRQTTIDENQLRQFALDIAKGMQYLSSKHIVHRDLATRNVLLDENLKAKVSDFGLARIVNPMDQEYNSSSRVFPRKWTAPEGIGGKFSSKSDVWSFGIVLIEIVTQGKEPFEGVENSELEEMLQREYIHPKPENCSYALYLLMMLCWNPSPSERISFENIIKELQNRKFIAEKIVFQKS